jgi:preprotein translocase subunit SecA
MIRNPIGFRERLARMRGSPVELDLGRYVNLVAAVERLGAELATRSDAALAAESRELAARAQSGEPTSQLVAAAYALVREASQRALGLRPYDVQVVAALALNDGYIVEMQTGEGKTLAAVMPAFLNALSGRGVHVLTFNDYLARRDAEWMGPVYALLGLSVRSVQSGMSADKRRHAYQADVTYVTAKEAGFDHLRDQLVTEPGLCVHRPFHLAIVDEADSLLIDEARVPLVIAGHVERAASSARRMAALVANLEPGVDFSLDEYSRNVELTDAGLLGVERSLGLDSLHSDEHLPMLTAINCALHAQVLLKRDVDYIVRDGRIELVDEFTGRVVDDRHWPDGLQAALEEKEGLSRQSDGQILGSITLQHFFAEYPRLCGMTGTAKDAADEVKEFYNLRTIVIPTHRPMIRVDHPDVVFTHRRAKEQAVVDEVRRVHATGRPVLLGTITIEASERLADRIRTAGIDCHVLNAKRDDEEAAIVARAGQLGTVTISTNMAGRGTDIKLGGPDGAQRARVVELGGLYIIGTDRHESRRVDLQLRGRAGRQGDPGESRFFVSLEDDLLVRYGVRHLIPARFMPEPQDEPIDMPVVNREIARAQRIIEGQNLEIRRTLWRYSMPVEEQRRIIQARRRALVSGETTPDLWCRDTARYDRLVAAVGEDAVHHAERAVALFEIDRAWRDHLSFVSDLREGIHLERLGGKDPLSRFGLQAAESFHEMEDRIDDAIADALEAVEVRGRVLDLSRIGIKGPSSTWTYLVNDDPFRNQLGMQLMGPGGATFAMGAAMVAMPLFLLMGVVDRFVRRRIRRR